LLLEDCEGHIQVFLDLEEVHNHHLVGFEGHNQTRPSGLVPCIDLLFLEDFVAEDRHDRG
jgi:hypothetical protein